jgi:DNA-binding Lrp family transcriptional regulator
VAGPSEGRREGNTQTDDGSPVRRLATDGEPVGRSWLAAEFGRRLDTLEVSGAVRGYAPLVDHDALDARTVVLRLRVERPDVPAVAVDLPEAGAGSVFEVTGSENLLAVIRFPDDPTREAFLAGLATDAGSSETATRGGCPDEPPRPGSEGRGPRTGSRSLAAIPVARAAESGGF